MKIGDWLVDTVTGEMRSMEGERRLKPKVLQVLLCLAAAPGEVRTRDEILLAVWGEGSVYDDALTSCIKQLRQAFGDSPRDPHYIRTVHKVGYALVADVAHPAPAAGADRGRPVVERPADEPAVPRRVVWRSPAWIAALAVVCVGMLAYFLTGEPPGAARDGPPAIAVLPFDAQGVPGEENYLGSGIAEEVRLILAQVPDLRVVASQSSERFGQSDAELTKIADRLKVDYILDGSIQADGGETLVFARLNNGATGYQLWSEKYRFSGADIFSVQTRIANSAAKALFDTLDFTSAVPDFDVQVPTNDLQAYDFYLRGRHHLNLRNSDDLEYAVRMFDRAIERDPEYGMPFVAKAYAVSLIPTNSLDVDEVSTQEARRLLRDAVDADPGVAEAALGIEAYLDLVEWRFVGAYEAYRQSLAAFPNEPILHHGYSLLMSSVGRHAEALDHALTAKDLDALSPVANGRLAVAYLWTGDDASAAEYFALSADLGLGSPANLQAYTLLQLRLGNYARARELGTRIQALLGLDADWWGVFVAAIEAGTIDEAGLDVIAAAAEGGQISLIMQLGAWAMLGEAERALDVLEVMFARRSSYIGGFLFSAELDDVRRHPRFGDLLEQSPLPRFWEAYGWTPHCSRGADGRIGCR
ncbi:MAG: winged helix-turn-helix domain-containing protein [Woeseiaceae bacterium]|nr:winged helix-turn-helix domain-containing protein [Woeseiaceae bacterium]